MDFEGLMSETPDPIIPFGIHEGNYASQIDVGYLKWVIGLKWLGRELQEQLTAHLKTREE